jgi:uncharacterized protein with PIN domain
MARIISLGNKPEERVARDTCFKCNAVVEYDRADIESDPHPNEKDFVRCPSCGALTAAHTLVWQDPNDGRIC